MIFKKKSLDLNLSTLFTSNNYICLIKFHIHVIPISYNILFEKLYTL